MQFGLKEKVCLDFSSLADFVILTIIQILALNADNATCNDMQTSALGVMENSFEEANCACCFNHTLQLSAKTLFKPFNVGMSLTKLASEEEETDNLNNEIWTLWDKGTVGDDESDGDEEGDKEAYGDDRDALDGSNKPNDADTDETDKLNQLDEQEQEKVLADTFVVRQTVTKVHSDPFQLDLTHC